MELHDRLPAGHRVWPRLALLGLPEQDVET